MTSSLRSMLLALVGASALAVPLGLATPADAQTKLKLVLNWKYQGPQGMFFLADDRGYFKAEGLDVTHRPGQRLRARRCRWWPTAPTTSASATSMR